MNDRDGTRDITIRITRITPEQEGDLIRVLNGMRDDGAAYAISVQRPAPRGS